LADGKRGGANVAKSLATLAMVNVGIWAISIIALVFVMERSSPARGMFPILAGGVAVGVSIISLTSKLRSEVKS